MFRSPFYNWYSKNWHTDFSKSVRSHWGVGVVHLQRDQSFKGTKEEGHERVAAIPFAAATAAGVITLLGLLGQNRGLAHQCQVEAVKVLDRLCDCITERSFNIRILPNHEVEVKDLMVQMQTFLSAYSQPFVKSLKQRFPDSELVTSSFFASILFGST